MRLHIPSAFTTLAAPLHTLRQRRAATTAITPIPLAPVMNADRSRLPDSIPVAPAIPSTKQLTPLHKPLPPAWNPRPAHEKAFSIPFKDLVIRPYAPRDLEQLCAIIKAALEEHNLPWQPQDSDSDVLTIPTSYKDGEFWVVDEVSTGVLVGSAAFRPLPQHGPGAVEVRKLFLVPRIRSDGLGGFLMSALEERARQLGNSVVVIETTSSLDICRKMYASRGYVQSTMTPHTPRADEILEKALGYAPVDGEFVETIDRTHGWSVTRMPREQAIERRLLFRAVIVLLESDGRVLVHRRSLKKSTYPGRMAALVTGCVDWGESPLTAAKREVHEEVGIDNLEFNVPFEPFVSSGKDDLGQRILFHPFVATGQFDENDIICDPDEVDCGMLMTREEVLKQGIGGSLWLEFRKHGL